MTDPAKSNPESDAARSDAKTADKSRENLKKAAEKRLDETRASDR